MTTLFAAAPNFSNARCGRSVRTSQIEANTTSFRRDEKSENVRIVVERIDDRQSCTTHQHIAELLRGRDRRSSEGVEPLNETQLYGASASINPLSNPRIFKLIEKMRTLSPFLCQIASSSCRICRRPHQNCSRKGKQRTDLPFPAERSVGEGDRVRSARCIVGRESSFTPGQILFQLISLENRRIERTTYLVILVGIRREVGFVCLDRQYGVMEEGQRTDRDR